MLRKRKQPTPSFKLPAPFQPITGERAPLVVKGVYPYVAMMQVAAKDTKRDYVICRGFDVRISRFIDYEKGNADKPGIPVAKPYSKRTVGAYTVGQIFPAVLPLQTDNPSPVDVLWRVGQNPGVAKKTAGHPADLDEEVETLKDAANVYINWMLLDSPGGGAEIIRFRVLSQGPFLGESADCYTVRAEVLDTICGSSSVKIGDQVIIHDPSGCHFNIPMDVLLNAHGTAVKMADSDDDGLSNCWELEQYYGYYLNGCWWMVQTLCCVEDLYDYNPALST